MNLTKQFNEKIWLKRQKYRNLSWESAKCLTDHNIEDFQNYSFIHQVCTNTKYGSGHMHTTFLHPILGQTAPILIYFHYMEKSDQNIL